MTFLFFRFRIFFLIFLCLRVNCYKIPPLQTTVNKYEIIKTKELTQIQFYKKRKLYNFYKQKLYSFNKEHNDTGDNIEKNIERNNNIVKKYLYNLYRKPFFLLSRSINNIRKASSYALKNIKESIFENNCLTKQIFFSVSFFLLHSFLLTKHFLILFPFQLIPNHSNLFMSIDLNSTLLVLTTLYFLKDIKKNFHKLKHKLNFGRFKLDLLENKKKNIFSISVLLIVSYVLSGYVSLYTENALNFFNHLNIFKYPISESVIKSLQILSGHFVWVISSIVIIKQLLYPYFKKKKSNLNFRYNEAWAIKVIYGYMCSHFIFNIIDVINNFLLNRFQTVGNEIYVDNSIDEIVNEKEFLSTLLCIISPCFSAPFFEEYIYRFFVLKGLNLFMSIHYSIFFSSLFFAIHHLNIYNLLPLFFLSFFWSYIYIYTDNILVTMVIHSFWNLYVFFFFFIQLTLELPSLPYIIYDI